MKIFLILMAAACLFISCKKPPTVIADGSPEFSGTMTVLHEGENFPQDGIKVQVEFSPDNSTMDIMLKKVKFVPAMPVSIDVTILHVPVTPEDDGSWSFAGHDMIPWAMGGPYDTYRVYDLHGTVSSSALTFSLGFYNTKKQENYPTSYSGTLLK